MSPPLIEHQGRPLFEESLTTRGYELNSRGWIPPAVIARYSEQSRWAALRSDLLGLGFGRGGRVVLRAQAHDLIEPLTFDVPLRLTLDVGRLGRSSLELRQLIMRADTDAVVVCSSATLVGLGADGRPAALPEAIMQHVRPGPMPTAEQLKGEAPVAAFRHAIEVRPCDIDLLQHVNHARYIEYADNTLQLAAHAGAFGAASANVFRSATRISADYRAETKLGQTISASVWPLTEQATGFGVELRHADTGVVSCRVRIDFGE